MNAREFRSAVLGQIGEARLEAAIDADIAGDMNHAKALDSDTTGALPDIHLRVGTAILFESTGGHVDKVDCLPELRFALGEPDGVDTTTIDNADNALESSGFFLRKVGTDGYRIHKQARLLRSTGIHRGIELTAPAGSGDRRRQNVETACGLQNRVESRDASMSWRERECGVAKGTISGGQSDGATAHDIVSSSAL